MLKQQTLFIVALSALRHPPLRECRQILVVSNRPVRVRIDLYRPETKRASLDIMVAE